MGTVVLQNQRKNSKNEFLILLDQKKTKTPTQDFFCEYCEIFINSFFYRTPLLLFLQLQLPTHHEQAGFEPGSKLNQVMNE